MEAGASSTDGQRLATGVPGLDTVLRGGLLRGSTYVLTGRPGSGKTVLASQISFQRAAAGETVLYAAMLSESHSRLLSNLRSLTFFDAALVGTRVHYLSGAAALESGGLEALGALLSREVRARGAGLLVLDSTGGAADVATSSFAYRQFLRELATGVAMAGCTALLLVPETQGAPSLEQAIADGIIELHQFDCGLRRGRELVLGKLRGSPSLPGRHVFQIDQRGVIVYPRREALPLSQPLTREVWTTCSGAACRAER
jgi:circadian clock protein KaiC